VIGIVLLVALGVNLVYDMFLLLDSFGPNHRDDWFFAVLGFWALLGIVGPSYFAVQEAIRSAALAAAFFGGHAAHGPRRLFWRASLSSVRIRCRAPSRWSRRPSSCNCAPGRERRW
jgi:hypothetical protein